MANWIDRLARFFQTRRRSTDLNPGQGKKALLSVRGCGPDGLGTGRRRGGSEGAEGVHVDYAPDVGVA